MTEQDPRLVELPVRLSQSKLWEIQRNYFNLMGVQAWKEEVPFYISSNAYIAHRYALLVLNFIKDWYALHPGTENPFYILEIGSGTGTFSFYFLRAFKELLATYNLADQRFCYLISDVVEKNVEFCKQNKSFLPFLEKQELDFTTLDVAGDQDFYLQLTKKKYSDLQVKTPLIIIANYTFDCIKQDAFLFKNDECQELKLGIRSRYKNFDVTKARHLNDLRLEYQFDTVDAAKYYSNPLLNEILLEYQQAFKEQSTYIMMPVGALQFIDNMRKLTHNQFFMIAGDKGISLRDKLPLLTKHHLASYDGCYSFMVNFDAMGNYLKKQGGDYLLTEKGNDFKVNLLCAGLTLKQLPETHAFFSTFLEKVGPDEFSNIFLEYLANSYRFSLRSILAFLRLSQYDPDAYAMIHDRLIEIIPALDQQAENDVCMALEKVRENIYRISISDDINNYIGIAYQYLDCPEKALELYHDSIELFPDKAASYNNAAIIYEKLKMPDKALDYYRKSIKLDKNNRFAKTKVAALTGKFTFRSLLPVIKGLSVLALLGLAIYLYQH